MPVKSPLTFLIFGDVVGRPGRTALSKIVPRLREELNPTLVIANAENLAHGTGVTRKSLAECQQAGIDFFTSGNHIFRRKETTELLTERDSVLIRPANYPPSTPGQGAKLLTLGTKKVLIINLNGRVFLNEDFDCPFRKLDEILKTYESEEPNAILVDFHTEATSETVAFGWYADSRVSLVFGTHTHVPTADQRILPGGTGYITDVGMVGVRDSVLGVDKDVIIRRFLTQQPFSHDIPESGIVQVNAILVTVNPKTMKTESIERLDREVSVE
ncbi:MAG: TIGR00282 family metallophosphoesterase [Patescibacteria group bacterium]|nr:TIGR00282 family metallophosphoesterase [Patescibacteria group bacterium]